MAVYTISPPHTVIFTFPYNSQPINGEFDDMEAKNSGIHFASGSKITRSAGAPFSIFPPSK